MTANTKALKLIRQFNPHWADVNEVISRTNSKRCALLCVNEILNVLKYENEYSDHINYWKQVKKEIEKL